MARFEELSDERRIVLFETLGRTALRQYGLESAEVSHRAYSENVIFEVRTADGGLYALRICRPNTDPTDLEREITWLHALARDTELRIPAPVMTDSGGPFTQAQVAGVRSGTQILRFVHVGLRRLRQRRRTHSAAARQSRGVLGAVAHPRGDVSAA